MPDASGGLVAVVNPIFNVDVCRVGAARLPDKLAIDGICVG